MLLERDAELAVLDALLDAAAEGRGGVAIVEGEAGIGKTSLLSAAAGAATRRGATVLRARGGELETDLAYGVARQLVEPLVRRRPELLTGAAALGAPALGLGVEHPAEGAFATQHGLYWLLDAVAADGPVLLCVDDAHWADPPSLRWLVYLTRRLDGLGVTVLVGWRPGEPGADEAALEALRAEPATCTVTPSCLSSAASARLVRSALDGDASLEIVEACHAVSGGKPVPAGPADPERRRRVGRRVRTRRGPPRRAAQAGPAPRGGDVVRGSAVRARFRR